MYDEFCVLILGLGHHCTVAFEIRHHLMAYKLRLKLSEPSAQLEFKNLFTKLPEIDIQMTYAANMISSIGGFTLSRR